MSRLRERRNMALSLDAMPRQRRSLFIFSLTSGIVALQMLYLALDDMTMNLWLTAAIVAGFTYSYYLEQRHRVFTEYWVSIFAIGVSLIYYSKIQAQPEYLGNFLGIMAGILIVLLAFKAFAPADHRFILLLETVVLIFSAVASFDLKYMLLLPLYLLAAGSALYVASQSEILSKVAESSPDTTQLAAANLVGRNFYRVLLRAVVGLLLLSVVAYTLTPHASRGERGLIFSSAPPVDEVAGRQSQQTPLEELEQIDTGNAEVGIGSDFDLTDGSRLTSRPTPVLAVKSHRNGYLRAQVYDYYIGTGWIRSSELSALEDLKPNLSMASFSANASDIYGRANSYLVPLFDFPSEVTRDRFAQNEHRGDVLIHINNVFSIDSKLDLQYEKIRQEIRLLEPQPALYFAMYQPAQLFNISLAAGSGDRLNNPRVDRASTIRPEKADGEHPKNFSYTVVSLEPRYRPRDLEQVAFAGPPEIRQAYTQLPLTAAPPNSEDGPAIDADKWMPISNRLRNLSAAIISRSGQSDNPPTPYEKVSAIYEYLTDSGEFTYSRDRQMVSSNLEQTEAFCLVSKEGYCRQFASAMAVLCRLNGVPARIVTGFAPGSYSLVDNAYIYKASDAHAWVEVYFDGYGWIIFDPSPTSRDLFNKSDLVRLVTGVTDFLSQLFVLDPAATQKMLVESLTKLWHSIIGYGPSAVLFIAVSLLLILIGVVVSRLPRPAAGQRLTPENAVVSSYLAVRDELARAGLRQEEGQTARAYLQAAAAYFEPLRSPLLRFVPIYEAAAFSPAQVSADEAALKELLRQVQQFVREEQVRQRRERRSGQEH